MRDDFFTRLAMQALGARPTARPAIAPIYAPQAAAPGAVGLIEIDEEAAPPPGPVASLPMDRVRRNPPPVSPISPNVAPTVDINQSRRHLPAQPDTRDRRAGHHAAWRDDDGITQPVAARSADAPQPTRPAVAAIVEPEQAAGAAVNRQSLRPHDSVDRQSVPRPVATGDWTILEPSRPIPPLPVASERAVPLSRDEPLRLRVEPEQPARPIVRVSIGRIDVRAVSAPVPARPAALKTATPAQTLSLDDYLRQRNESRR